MSRDRKTPADQLLTQIRSCLDASTGQPGLVKASVYQTEGYLRGLQGLPWEAPVPTVPSREDAASSFLHDVRRGAVALRGRTKSDSKRCLEAFRSGFEKTFYESSEKQFCKALPRLWVRWLATAPAASDPLEFSDAAGRGAGEILKREYSEGLAGNLAAFLLDKRLHLDGVIGFLRMRGWLTGIIEHLRTTPDPTRRDRAEILNANFSSILLRAQHNAGPGYAAEVVEKLASIMSGLDLAIRNLASTEPETSEYLRNNRATIITRALHSGVFDYGGRVAEELPSMLKSVEARNKRSLVYRAITNGRFDALRKSKL